MWIYGFKFLTYWRGIISIVVILSPEAISVYVGEVGHLKDGIELNLGDGIFILRTDVRSGKPNLGLWFTFGQIDFMHRIAFQKVNGAEMRYFGVEVSAKALVANNSDEVMKC